MIPSSSITSLYARLIGERALLAVAQGNLMDHLARITAQRTHTYLANNAQNEHGISRNFGHERFYVWEDTTVDCRYAPSLADEEVLAGLTETIAAGAKFKKFKKEIERRSDGLITVESFCGISRGSENRRYDIRRDQGRLDFDIVRVGTKLCAADEAAFKQGLENIRRAEDPFHINKPVLSHRADGQLVQA